MTNPGRLLHGGGRSGMLDDAMGLLANALGREFFLASVNLGIDFRHGARGRHVVTATAQVVRNGAYRQHGGRTAQSAWQLIARAQSNLTNPVSLTHFKYATGLQPALDAVCNQNYSQYWRGLQAG